MKPSKKLGNKRGLCGKGKPFQKQGLTPTEQKKVDLHQKWAKERWEYLLSLNKWTRVS
jgi:hypothetical protein